MESNFNINLDNPFYDNPNRIDEMAFIDSMVDKSPEQQQYLNERDKYDVVSDDLVKIRKSDGIMAFAQDVRVGTIMEIFFAAYVLHLPVYVFTRRYYYHPWIEKFATHVFRNLKELENFIERNYGKKINLQ